MEQKDFSLTREMVPIDSDDNASFFICPLPKGFKEKVKNHPLSIEAWCDRAVEFINREAAAQNPPFNTILDKFKDRTEGEQKGLLNQFKITRVYRDIRGVSAVYVGDEINSGDIYLSMEVTFYNKNVPYQFRKFLEEDVAFVCHNVDSYWQALLLREFCILYYNFLNSKLFPLQAGID